LFAVNRGQLHGRLHGYAVMNQALRLKTGQMPRIVLDDGRNVDLAAPHAATYWERRMRRL